MTVLILTKESTHKYETEKLEISFNERNLKARIGYFKDFDIIANYGIFHNGEPFEMPQLVLVRLGAGITNTELAIIKYFELFGIPCINSSSSIAAARDKYHSSHILQHGGIAIPTTMLVKHSKPNNLVGSKIGFPCIVKVVIGSFGNGVYFVNSEQEYFKLIEFLHSTGNKKTLIVQEYLGDVPGEDLRVLVIGGGVVGAMRRTAPVGDFRANISNGGTGSSYPITAEIAEIALTAANLLGLDIAGVDLLFDNRGFRVCEVNSNPGYSGFDQYCATNVADHIATYIERKLGL